MTPARLRTDDREVDRLRELASIGAGHAAGALARLVKRPVRMDVPVVHELSPDLVCASSILAAEEGGMGVFFELNGGVGGIVAVVFSSRALDALVERLLGPEARARFDEEVESAVREVANILVSSHASAIADTLGTFMIPSVPLLVRDELAVALASFVRVRAQDPPGILVESEIYEAEGVVRGFLLFVPGPEATEPRV